MTSSLQLSLYIRDSHIGVILENLFYRDFPGIIMIVYRMFLRRKSILSILF